MAIGAYIEMKTKEELKDLKYDFHIYLTDSPIVWEGVNFEGVDQLFPKREPFHHPGLRYEDIVAHLFMQCLSYNRYSGVLVKAARQYANQAMKRICRHCERSQAVDGVYSDTSSIFANEIYMHSTRSKECITCRVGRAIVFGNQFDYLLTGVSVSDYADSEKRVIIHEIRWRKFQKMFKRERFIKRKVIADKQELTKRLVSLETFIEDTKTDVVHSANTE